MAGFLDTSLLLDEEFKKKMVGPYTIKALGIVAFLLYFIFLFSMTGKDKSLLSGTHIAFFLTVSLIPLLLFSFFIMSSLKDTKYLVFLAGLVVILILVLFRTYLPSVSNVFYYFLNFITDVTPLPGLSRDYSFLVLVFFKLLMVFIVLIGLSIVYNVFLNEGYRQTGAVGFLIYLIFFIPCLISDFAAYLLDELRATPVVVYFLMGVELLLILLYVFLPKLLQKVHLTSGTQIIKNPTYFYGTETISDITPFYTTNKDIYSNDFSREDLHKKTIRREYAISMWMTTNEPTFGRADCMMFRFGKNNEDKGCPYISCTKEGKWKFVVSNSIVADKVTTEFVVPMQRWNYVVMNYHNTEVDIFINGELLETIYLEGSYLPKYDDTMEMSIGSETNELHGAICNVTIYREILSTTQISQSYNILRLQNPPVYNVM